MLINKYDKIKYIVAEIAKNLGLEARNCPENMVTLASSMALGSSLYIKALISFGKSNKFKV